VLADGSSLWFGGQVVDPPEYDFVSLLTGSEGTLALITQAVLRLKHSAAGVKTLTASFDDVATAGRAVSAVISAGLSPATIELMDHNMINIVEDYLGLGLLRQAAALLIFDVEGYQASLDNQLDAVEEILQRFQPLEIKIARTAQERDRLWLGRRNASGAVARLSPSEYTLDVCVPRSRLAEALSQINEIAARYDLPVTYLAHAGDGNLHPGLLCDLSLVEDNQRVHQAGDEILRYCAAIGGSISGEHGIGIEKRNYMTCMYGAHELETMLQVKQIFDPSSLLNPGKIFPSNLGDPSLIVGAPEQPAGDIFEPHSAQEAAAGLLAFQNGGQVVRLVGNSQQWQGGSQSGRMLSTARLDGVKMISADDFFVTAQAGARLDELQAALSEDGFWLPISSPWPAITLGGLIASNLNSPLRTLYGGLRDLVLAVQVALADGRLLRFGRPLMKDVAGYQMNKLFCGSYGTLGLLTEATLKIFPLPRARKTLILSGLELNQGLRAGFDALRILTIGSGIILLPGTLEDSRASGCSLVLTVEGHAGDVEEELSIIRNRLERYGSIEILENDLSAAHQVWAGRLTEFSFVIRAAVPASKLLQFVNEYDEGFLTGEWLIDLANGVIWFGRKQNDGNMVQSDLEKARRVAAVLDGYAVLAAGQRRWFQELDTWGSRPPAFSLMRTLKLRWDPADILNRGEFV
jgi:FAD/FMN-containing dehydrogenase